MHPEWANRRAIAASHPEWATILLPRYRRAAKVIWLELLLGSLGIGALIFELADAGLFSGEITRGPPALTMVLILGLLFAFGLMRLVGSVLIQDNKTILAEDTGIWLNDSDVLAMSMRGNLK